MRCHKAQGMTEAFTDTLYSRAKTSSSVHQKAVFTAARQQIICQGLYYRKKLPSCPAPCDSAPPPPESSCSRSLYSRFLVSELKYTFPNTFHTPRARVSRNLKVASGRICMHVDHTLIEKSLVWLLFWAILGMRLQYSQSTAELMLPLAIGNLG